MTSDMSPTERLTRQKNVTLQRQLTVTLQILDREGKTAQQELQKVIREHRHFLLDIASRWTGLDDYIQPDTRAIKRTTSVTERPAPTPLEEAGKNIHSSTTARKMSRLSVGTSPGTNCTHSTKLTTCIEVLDDIIQNHHLRKKVMRCRKIGLMFPTDARSDLPEAYPGSAKDHSTSRAVTSNQSIRIRPASSYIRGASRGSVDVYARPQTAQPRLSSYGERSPGRTSSAPTDQSSYHRRRPKSVPLKYELYGRSPAVSRQTVAGIMAEVKSQCTATRKLIGQSKQLHDYVASLG